MALPSPSFYSTGDVEQTTHDFGSCEAGQYKPDATGWKVIVWNDKGGSLGSDDMTSVKISVRDVDGGVDELWTTQHWIQIKSDGGSTGLVDDAQTVFAAVGKNKELSLGDIPSDEYRTLYVRCYPPTDAKEDASIEFQLRVTYQQPATSICNWITGLRGNGVVASTGDPFAMSTGGSSGTIPYESGYALVYNNEIYYGSSGNFDCSTGSSGTNSIYLTESGSFGMSTGTSVDTNQLKLYGAEIDDSGNCTDLTDKRVYLAGLQVGSTGAMSTNPDLGDLYFDYVNGDIYAAKSAGTYTLIISGSTGTPSFLTLTDTPADYASDAGKILRVDTSSGAVEFISSTGINHNDFGGLDSGDYQHLTAIEDAGLNATEQTTSPTTGTVTIDWSAGRNFLYIRSTGSNGEVIFDFSNPPNISADLRLIVKGSTAGSTGDINWSTGQTIYWEAAPSFSSGVDFVNKVNFYYSSGLDAYLAETTTGYGLL